MKKWMMIVDVAKCNNCQNCVMAAKDEYVGNDFPGYSVAQPSKGHEWITVDRHIRGDGSMVDVTYVPRMCNHCDNAPCVAASGGAILKRALPPRATHRRRQATARPRLAPVQERILAARRP